MTKTTLQEAEAMGLYIAPLDTRTIEELEEATEARLAALRETLIGLPARPGTIR